MRVGDRLLGFGPVAAHNNKGLTALVHEVGANVGKAIAVTVRREDDSVAVLKLTPQAWGGRGMLGCHLSPL